MLHIYSTEVQNLMSYYSKNDVIMLKKRYIYRTDNVWNIHCLNMTAVNQRLQLSRRQDEICTDPFFNARIS